MPSTIVVALGGNALQRKGEASANAQQRVARSTAAQLVPLIQDGHRLVIVHGNGPQVGNIVLHEEAINTPEVPTLPLDSNVAMSQGLIGYWLQQALTDELRKVDLRNPVVTLVTRVRVDEDDPAFTNPTKPIGPFYKTENEAKNAAAERDFIVREDAGRGWRRVVASPLPKEIIEIDTIHQLTKSGAVVVAAGGGGVPVISKSTGYEGIEAVIDKDFSAAVLADTIDADRLIILTTVDSAMINYGTPEQTALGEVTSEEMRQYAADNQFASGSMLPKVMAALQFVEENDSRRAVIASLDTVAMAVEGKSGTEIRR
jgi:carbamate kinase